MTEVSEQKIISSADVVSENKSFAEVQDSDGERDLKWLPFGVTSFADFDAMEEAQKQAIAIKNDASLFKALVDNILELDPDQGDKSQLIVDLANEFSQRIQQPVEKKEVNDLDQLFTELAKDYEFIEEYIKQKPEYDELLQEIKSKRQWLEDDHYKEVSQDALKATDEDFRGGCPCCRFGEVDKLKGLEKCPYCQNALEVIE